MDFISAFIFLCASTASASTVQTKYGNIEGTTVTLYNGEQVDAYLGVPYAAPPIGSNRFAPPQPLASWDGTLETKNVSKSCFQSVPEELKKIIWFLAEEPESEDCLYLNVWKPSNWTSEDMTVIVWIHPGAFFSGSASMPLYDGAILASEKKIIVVSMNYRLSMFGNLYLNNAEAPGNVGLQDQIQAIKWVNENIRNFGGDPMKITLFGESAGGLSISFHLLNPNVFNLFQYGILESGSLNMAPITLTKEVSLNYSLTLGTSLGCPVDDKELLISCLRDQSATDLLKNYRVFPTYGHFPFNPVRNGKEIPLNPSDIDNLSFPQRKKLMVGNLPMSGSIMVPMFFPGKVLTDDLAVSKNDLRNMLKYYLLLDDEKLQNIVLDEYRDDELPDNKSQLRLNGIDIFSDTLFTCPVSDFAKVYSSDDADLYYYWYDYKPSRPMKFPVPDWVGPIHGEEIPFVFGAPLDPRNNYTEYEGNLSREIMTYWVNFANNGNPNGEGLVMWPAHKPNTALVCLYLTNQMTTSTLNFPKEKECNFWREIYPDLLSKQGDLEKGE